MGRFGHLADVTPEDEKAPFLPIGVEAVVKITRSFYDEKAYKGPSLKVSMTIEEVIEGEVQEGEMYFWYLSLPEPKNDNDWPAHRGLRDPKDFVGGVKGLVDQEVEVSNLQEDLPLNDLDEGISDKELLALWWDTATEEVSRGNMDKLVKVTTTRSGAQWVRHNWFAV